MSKKRFRKRFSSKKRETGEAVGGGGLASASTIDIIYTDNTIESNEAKPIGHVSYTIDISGEVEEYTPVTQTLSSREL